MAGILVALTAVWAIFRYGFHYHDQITHGTGWALLIAWIIWMIFKGGGGDGDSVEMGVEFLTCDHPEGE